MRYHIVILDHIIINVAFIFSFVVNITIGIKLNLSSLRYLFGNYGSYKYLLAKNEQTV